ncbi:MAG: MBL fold metallo-hydrolase [Gemmatimonadota bacterium]
MRLMSLALGVSLGVLGRPGPQTAIPSAARDLLRGVQTPQSRPLGMTDSARARRARSPAAFEFRKIRDDIYHAIGTGALGVGSNAVVVINAHDVLLVDSHTSPRAARALLAELKTITPNPVKYVVNTHFHHDHVNGNQVYPADVEIIGHEFTREMIATGKTKSGRAFQSYVAFLAAQVRAHSQEADAAKDPAVRAGARVKLARARADQREGTTEVRPTAPNWTLSERITLFRGGREIEIIFFGRGHTGGDIVVYLPKERVLATGDLLQARLPFMGDGYMDEWVETLERIKSLDFNVILPGHGEAFRDRSAIDHLQGFLRDFWRQAVDLHSAGVDINAAARRMDFSAYAPFYRQIADTADLYDRLQGGLIRAYELLDRKQ